MNDHFSQGNPEDQQKSQIWASQSIPLNSSSPCILHSTKLCLQTKEEHYKIKEAIRDWPETKSSKNQINSIEKNTNLVIQSNKKVSKNVHERTKRNDAICISRRLDFIFNQCRKVPPSVRRILLGKGSIPSNFKCFFQREITLPA